MLDLTPSLKGQLWSTWVQFYCFLTLKLFLYCTHVGFDPLFKEGMSNPTWENNKGTSSKLRSNFIDCTHVDHSPSLKRGCQIQHGENNKGSNFKVKKQGGSLLYPCRLTAPFKEGVKSNMGRTIKEQLQS